MELKTFFLLQLFAYVTITISEPQQESVFEDMVTSDDMDDREDFQEEQTMADFNPQMPQLDSSDCQFKTIKKCNHKFKNMFHGVNLQVASNDKELYCKGMQVTSIKLAFVI